MVAIPIEFVPGDSSETRAVIDEIKALRKRISNLPEEVRQLAIQCRDRSAFEIETHTTGRTVHVSLKPGKRLLDLLAALRALD